MPNLFAAKLRKSIAYAWYPGATGFVRNTLGAYKCDVIMGMPQGDDLVQVTNPYYRTAYALVFKPGNGLDGVETLADPRLKGKRLGIVAGTPPANYMSVNGLMASAKPYPLVIDTRVDSSAAAMIHDLADGKIDAAVLWGPMAGYYAKQMTPPATVVPLVKERGPGPPMAFWIGMGVRYTDQEWKRQLNRMIQQNRGEISDMLLTSACRCSTRTITRSLLVRCKKRHEVGESEFRDRRAHCLRAVRVGAGAAAVGASDLPHRELSRANASDANGRARVDHRRGGSDLGTRRRSLCRRAATSAAAANLPVGTVWRDRQRLDIPGSIWLPDTGYGELAPVTEQYFRTGLSRRSRTATRPSCW